MKHSWFLVALFLLFFFLLGTPNIYVQRQCNPKTSLSACYLFPASNPSNANSGCFVWSSLSSSVCLCDGLISLFMSPFYKAYHCINCVLQYLNYSPHFSITRPWIWVCASADTVDSVYFIFSWNLSKKSLKKSFFKICKSILRKLLPTSFLKVLIWG